jgi:putative phosphoesterase
VRLALISDLHGNLPALEAVIRALEADAVDRLVCLGDVAAGPQPVETTERLRELECPVVLGNWDAWLVDGAPPSDVPGGAKIRDQGVWQAEQLDEPSREFLRSLPPSVQIELGEKTALCVHGSPRSMMEDIDATTPDDVLAHMLEGSTPSLVAAGHTHVQLVRPQNGTLFVNPGSVGLPFHRRPADGGPLFSPWAEYALVTVDGKVDAELRRAPYDVAALLETAVEREMPHARWWSAAWLT